MREFSAAKKISIDAAAWDVFAAHQPYYHILCHPTMLRPDAAAVEDFWASGERDIQHLQGFAGLERVNGVGLDLGCGLGRLTRALRLLTSEQIGLDISAEMIRQAREQNREYSTVQFRQLTGGAWPVDSGTVSLIVSLHVLQHMSSLELIEESIAEMGRVLKPSGWAVFNVPTMRWRGEIVARFKQALHLGRQRHTNELRQLEQRLARFAETGSENFTEQEIMGEMFRLDARRMKSLPIRRLRRSCRRAGLSVRKFDRTMPHSTYIALQKN